jgi:hypothetical protein
LVRKDKSDEVSATRIVKAMDDMESRSSVALVRGAEICAASERERNAAMRELMGALARAMAVIERLEREAKE